MKIENDSIVSRDGITYGKVWEVDGLWFSKVFAKCVERVDAGDYEYSDVRDIPSFAYVLGRHDTRKDMEEYVAGLTFGRQHSPFGENLHFVDYTDEDSENLRMVEITDDEPEEIEGKESYMVNDAIRTRDRRLEDERKLREWKFQPGRHKLEIIPHGDWDHCLVYDLVHHGEKKHVIMRAEYNHPKTWGCSDDDHYKGWYDFRGHKFPDQESLLQWIHSDIEVFELKGDYDYGYNAVFKEQSFSVDADNLHVFVWDKVTAYYIKRSDMLHNIGESHHRIKPESKFIAEYNKGQISCPWLDIDYNRKDLPAYFDSAEAARKWVLANIDEVRVDADGQSTAWKDGKPVEIKSH